MSDLPDFSEGVYIIGYTIESIPIDIVAQTIGNIGIDIKAQTFGNLNVNIAASAVTMQVNLYSSSITLDIHIASQEANLTIDIAAQTLEALTINIAGGVSDVRTGHIINAEFEEGDVGWKFVDDAATDDAHPLFGDLSCLFPITGAYPMIKQGSFIPTIDTNKIGSIKFSVLTQDQRDYLSVGLLYSDGTDEWTECRPTAAGAYETFDIDYTADKHIVLVEIWRDSAGYGYVYGDGFYINRSIDELASIVSSVTINMNILSQSVDIDIKTSGGVNIIIDKLTQTAYTERRSTLSNNGVLAFWTESSGTTRLGKFFPRGCRGFIKTIDVYCRDGGVAGGTITVYISPHPSMGYLYSATVTVPAEGAADWRSATFNIMWNYDSMFIWVLSSVADMEFGYDFIENPDGYESTDSAVTWTVDTYRYGYRVIMTAQTIGDIPVSGTINTIPIPLLASARQAQVLAVPAESELLDTVQVGAGEVLFILFEARDADAMADLVPRIRCDGGSVLPFDSNLGLWQSRYVTASTPKITIGVWDTTNHYYNLIVTIPYPFKRSLQVGFYNAGGAERTGYVGYSLKKVS